MDEATAIVRRRAWLAVGETLAALAICFGLSLAAGAVMMLVMAPPAFHAEVDVEPVEARESGPTPLLEVAEELRARGLAREVAIRSADGGPAGLTLRELAETTGLHDRLTSLLAAHGYRMVNLRMDGGFDPAEASRVILRPYLTFQSLLFLGAALLLLRLRLRGPEGEPAAPGLPVPAALAAGVGAGIAAFAASVAISSLQTVLGLPVEEQDWIRELLSDRTRVLALAPWIVLLAPIAEEVFFRGYMFRFLIRHAGSAVAFAVSAGAFTLIHFNLSGLLVYLAIGLIFAWLLRRTGRLVSPILAHVVYNGLVLGSVLLLPVP